MAEDMGFVTCEVLDPICNAEWVSCSQVSLVPLSVLMEESRGRQGVFLSDTSPSSAPVPLSPPLSGTTENLIPLKRTEHWTKQSLSSVLTCS